MNPHLPRWRTLLFAGITLSCLLSPAGLFGQSKRIIQVPRHGVDVFANILHEQGLKPIQNIDDLNKANPNKTVVIVFGKFDALPAIEAAVGGLQNFLNNGGALLIASDYPDEGQLASIGFGITGKPVFVRDKANGFLEHFRSCPVLPIQPGAEAHSILRDVKGPVVTDRPSAFYRAPAFSRSLARYPETTQVMEPFLEKPPSAFNSPWLMEKSFGDGKVVALTGHGFFMNCFLVRQDFDNFLLARNIARYLTEHPQGARTNVLLIEQGQVIRKLDLPLDSPPFPITPMLNIFIDQAQRHGLIDQFFEGLPRREIWLWGLISVTGTGVMLGFRRLYRSRFRRETRAALVVGLNDPGPPPMPLLRQRQDEILHGGNYAEPARTLARRWLALEAGESASGMPLYDVKTTWWRRRRLKRELAWVELLVSRSPLGRVKARELSRLGQVLSELSQSLQRGEIRFVSASASSTKDG